MGNKKILATSSQNAKLSLKLRPPIIFRRVYGQSMSPTIKPGKIAVGRSIFMNLDVGQIVIFKHNGCEMIKRITFVDGDKFFVEGDNPKFSTDSRKFGLVSRSQIIASVLIK